MEKKSIITLKKGETGVISEIQASDVSQRLIEMGLTIGSSFQIRSISPFGDPIAIRLKDFAISLRLSDAKDILVHSN
jgi:ferrous iron transport protein A